MSQGPFKSVYLIILTFSCLCLSAPLLAQEVEKGKIPTEQLENSYKKLAWGANIWDTDEAVVQLKKSKNVLWVDTRLESLFKKGTVHGAVCLNYYKKETPENSLTAESLEKALADKGIAKDQATIAFFCQGPKCHRSYNATYVAITDWGYAPEQIVWFRAGYPFLFKKVQADAKLKRKAKRYLSDAAIKQL